jgi:Recombination endonuclease VII
MKICSKCNTEKPLDLYYKHRLGKGGYKSQCKECENQYAKARYEKEKQSGTKYIKSKKDSLRKSSLLKNFGITVDQYESLLRKQDNKCAICEVDQSLVEKKFAVDHSHEASDFIPEGAIRGLLCHDCNTRLIAERTDPHIFERAAQYLRQFTGLRVPTRKGRNSG